MTKENIYLSGGLPKLYLITAAPIIVVMLVQGFYTLVDTYFLGEPGIWYAAPASELMLLCLVLLVLYQRYRKTGYKFGVFQLPTAAS